MVTQSRALRDCTVRCTRSGPNTPDAAAAVMAEGDSPVPVPKGEKNPNRKGWQDLRLGSGDLGLFAPDGNLGLLTGVNNRVDIDLDCAEARTLGALLLPETHCRHGRPSARNSHWHYRADPLPTSIKINDPALPADQSCIIEIRAARRQTIIPPSLHPSGEQISWEEHCVPEHVDGRLLTPAVMAIAALTIVARCWPGAGSRHEAALSLAGVLVRCGHAEDEVAELVQTVAELGGDDEACLRANDARDTYRAYHAGRHTYGLPHLLDQLRIDEKRAAFLKRYLRQRGGPLKPEDNGDSASTDGKDVDTDRGPHGRRAAGGEEGIRGPSIATQLVGLALAAEVELFRTPDDEYFASIPVNAHREHRPLEGSEFGEWLADLCFEDLGLAPSQEAVRSAVATLCGHARRGGQVLPVFTRVGEHEDRAYIDLLNASWQAIEVSSDGWSVIDDPPCCFRRAKGMLPMPEPVRGGTMGELRGLLNLPDDDNGWMMLVTFLVASLFPRGPYPILSLGGGAGRGKSMAATIIRSLLDPAQAPLSSPPKSERDLVIAARNSWCIALDNISSLPKEMSNALCRLCYGSGMRTRRLYKDAEEVIFSGARPIVLNGIPDYVEEPDLVDRCIPLRLPKIPKDRRRTEKALLAEAETAAPHILGALLDVMVYVLAHEHVTVPAELPRMADFATLGYRAAPTLGWGGKDFLAVYDGAQTESLAATIENSQVAMAIQEFVSRLTAPFQGTATELKAALEADNGSCFQLSIDPEQRPWPQKPVQLANELRRMEPALDAVGLTVEFERASHSGRRLITLRKSASQSLAQKSSPSSPSSPVGGLERKAGDDSGERGDDSGDASGSPGRHPKSGGSTPIAAGGDDGDDSVADSSVSVQELQDHTDLAEYTAWAKAGQ